MSEAIDCVFSAEGQGPALLMVHGIGGRRQGWKGLIDHFKSDFHCISYDLRGHGDSPVPTARFGLDDLVEDLESVRRRAGVQKAHIIGHSLGGMIGPAYARKYPDRVLSLTLLSTAAFRTAEDSAKVRGVVAALKEKGIGPMYDVLVDRWFTDEFVRTRPDGVEARRKEVEETNPRIFLNVFEIYAETEMAPWLHEVESPSLVLTGEFDGGCNPRLNEQIAAALPNAELVILRGLKHSIVQEAPERVAEPVGKFLRAHKQTS